MSEGEGEERVVSVPEWTKHEVARKRAEELGLTAEPDCGACAEWIYTGSVWSDHTEACFKRAREAVYGDAASLLVEAELEGERLPVYIIEDVSRVCENAFMIRARGAEIASFFDGENYGVGVKEDGKLVRAYDDRQTPHARTVFWAAMAFLHEKEEWYAARR